MGFGGSEQEWGYVTVRPSAHMFWWLHYTTAKEVTNVYEKPLLVRLCGGLCNTTTAFGDFHNLSLFHSDLQPRKFSWVTIQKTKKKIETFSNNFFFNDQVNNYNVLCTDTPVGRGFSYVDTDFGFARTNAQVGADLLECIRGFLSENPKFETVPTYIIVEYYGGSMAAELALVWIKV